MQDRYVGDAGDFAKYSLLNALAAEMPNLRLGVLWYLFPNESHNDDGRHIAYLAQPIMAERDPATHAKLAQLVAEGKRSVRWVQRAGLLPADTTFYARRAAAIGRPHERSAYRRAWFAEGLKQLAPADLLFFDPDNGIETAALSKSDHRAAKYVFWEEIDAAWKRGHSLIIYNHLNRSATAAVQTARLSSAFQQRLPDAAAIIALLFRRGSCRHLWVIVQHRHRALLVPRVEAFLRRGWERDTECDLSTGSGLSVSQAE